jgi:ACS family allantoate permease-like MFS transporter
MFMTQYYKAGEQGTRTGVWMSANSFAPILGASLAYGLYTADMKGDLPMAGWKLVYIILGVATSATGVLFLIFVPDTPAGARWLSPTDRKLAVERVRSGQQGVINHEFRFNQVKEAFRDPFVSLSIGIILSTADRVRHGCTPLSLYAHVSPMEVSPSK